MQEVPALTLQTEVPVTAVCCTMGRFAFFLRMYRAVCRRRVSALTFAGPDVVQVQLVALLGSLQGAFGGKEVAGGVVGLVVSAADLKQENSVSSSFLPPTE